MKEFLKKFKIDIIVIASLLAVSLGTLIWITSKRNNNNLVAEFHHHNDVVLTIDLSKESNTRLITVEGDKGDVVFEVKNNAIRAIESSCPHKDCVNVGWVTTTNKPIICAYNAVYVLVTSNSNGNDLEI